MIHATDSQIQTRSAPAITHPPAPMRSLVIFASSILRSARALFRSREGFRRYWRSISTPGPGRPPISREVQELIVRMATENCWRSRKIQAELMKLGIRVSLALRAESQTRSHSTATQDDLPSESQGCDCRDGLLRRPHRQVPAAVRLVRDRSRSTEDPAFQCHREPDCALSHPAAARDIPRRTHASFPDLRQRFHLLGRCYPRDQEFRDGPEAHRLPEPIAERKAERVGGLHHRYHWSEPA
jgi:hypothetical protein